MIAITVCIYNNSKFVLMVICIVIRQLIVNAMVCSVFAFSIAVGLLKIRLALLIIWNMLVLT